MSEKKDVVGLHFAGSTFQTFFMLILGQLLALVISVITARALGPAGKGVTAVVLLYPTLLFNLGHLSVHRAIFSQVGSGRYTMRDFCGSLGFFAIFVSALLMGAFWCGYSLFPAFFIQGVSPHLILLGLAALPFFFINLLYGSIVQSQQEITKVNIIVFSQAFSTCLFLLIVWGTVGLTVTRVVFCYVIANAAAAGLAFGFAARLFPGGWRINLALLGGLVKDGLKLHLGVISIFIFLKIDQLMLNQYRGAASLGIYTISVSYSDLLLLAPTAIQNVFYAKVSRMLKEKIDLVPKTLLLYRHNFYVLLVMSAVLALCAHPFILFFFGRSFLSALSPFFVLLPGVFFLYWNNVLTNYMVSTRKFWTISIIAAATALVNILLNMIFIPRWDAMGAALASTMAYSLASVAYMKVFLNFGGLRAKDLWKNLRLTREDVSLYRQLIGSFFGEK